MIRKSYQDELMRATARHDIAVLRERVELYYQFNKGSGKEREALLEERFRDFDPYFFPSDDPDMGMAIVALALSMFDDPAFLGVIAAGPLEDLLQKPSSEILERILAESRKNARFRWLLRGVYPHAIAETARLQIAAVVGSITEAEPLPPRSA